MLANSDKLLNILNSVPDNDYVVPDVVGKYKGRQLLLVASGRCVWDDLGKVQPSNFDILCINDIVMHLPYKVNHMFSLDTRMIHKWVEARRPVYKKSMDANEPIATHAVHRGTKYRWPFDRAGNSGIIGCLVGLAMGYDRIVLAGCPADGSGHYFDPPAESHLPHQQANYASEDRRWHTYEQEFFQGRVKSISGNTHTLLGGI